MSIMCSYENCLCVKYPCSSIAFFRLPSDSRRSTWIKNSGNKSLKNISAKAHRFFCENHFRECDIRTQFNRKILRKHAVPMEYNDLKNTILLTRDNGHCNKSSTFVDQHKQSNTEGNLVVETINVDTDILDEYGNGDIQNQIIDNTNIPIEEDINNSRTEMDFYLQEPCEEYEHYEGNYSPEASQRIDLDDIVYIDPNSSRPDSSTVDLQYIADVDSAVEVSVDNLRPIEAQMSAPINCNNRCTSSATDYEEDRHFALSLVGYFQRLPKDRRALAKLKILQYLTDLDIGLSSNL